MANLRTEMKAISSINAVLNDLDTPSEKRVLEYFDAGGKKRKVTKRKKRKAAKKKKVTKRKKKVAKKRKYKARKKKGRMSPEDVLRAMGTKKATALGLAKKTGKSAASIGKHLGVLLDAKKIKRVKRGVYVRK